VEERSTLLFNKNVNDPPERGYNKINKHIFLFIRFISLTIEIFLLLYKYFQKVFVIRDGWLTFLLMVSAFMINTPYWKNYLKKNDNSLSIIKYLNVGFIKLNL
tara:strand:- start:1969 stop:2277 length:309 start_codon:yes stop_codon:yes gene_type:complete